MNCWRTSTRTYRQTNCPTLLVSVHQRADGQLCIPLHIALQEELVLQAFAPVQMLLNPCIAMPDVSRLHRHLDQQSRILFNCFHLIHSIFPTPACEAGELLLELGNNLEMVAHVGC